jgi:NADH-quinone oxidoreductase subunit F
VTRHLDALASGEGEDDDIDVIARRLRNVTDQNRCFLGEQEQRVVSSLLRTFPEDFVVQLEDPAVLDRLPVPKITDIRDGVATYDAQVMRKLPDWTYES